MQKTIHSSSNNPPNAEKPKLISFNVCPFVQRSVILLKEKNIDYDIEYIDVYDPPEWFLLLSPTGKVPVLSINGTVLFESAVINEYLDEAYAPQLHPSDLLTKAHNRAWMEYTTPMYFDTFNLMMGKTQEQVNTVLQSLSKSLSGLEDSKEKSPWFNGADFSMMDISVAPLFTRVSFFIKHCGIDLLKDFPKLRQWSDAVLARQSVIESLVENYDEIMVERMQQNESYLKEPLINSEVP